MAAPYKEEENKNIFEYEGTKYNVRDEYLEDFIDKHPDATTILNRDEQKYRVKASDFKTFNMSAPKEEREAINGNFDKIDRTLSETTNAATERADNWSEYQQKGGGGYVVDGKPKMNEQTGRFEQTYISPMGNKHTDKGIAEAEASIVRKGVADMTASGRLKAANNRLAQLKQKQSDGSSYDQWAAEQSGNNSKGEWLMNNMTPQTPLATNAEQSIGLAIKRTEEEIAVLERQRERESGNNGFWRNITDLAQGIGDTFNADNYSMGAVPLGDSITTLRASDNANKSDDESAADQELLQAIHSKEQSEGMFAKNDSFMYNTGVQSGNMIPFMIDFGLSGGLTSGAKAVFTKAASGAATKAVGKEAIEAMAKQGLKSYIKENGVKGVGMAATNWTIKALGTAADDLLIRAPIMTNTVQAAKTASSIIDHKLGRVVNEAGELSLDNSATWGDALWQEEADSIIENASEMFGTNILDPITSKLSNLVGAKALGGVLAKADSQTLSKVVDNTNKLFNKLGVSDYAGEVTEEYYGQLMRTVLDLDSAYQYNEDGTKTNLLATKEFHTDLWGGMAISMGLMGVAKGGVSSANYYAMKHGVDKADKRANEVFDKEVWGSLRSTIDLTTNDDMGDVVVNILQDPTLTSQEKEAAINYTERSLNFRGANLATMAKARGEAMSNELSEVNECYSNGYNTASPQEMTDAFNLFTHQQTKATESLGAEAVDYLSQRQVGEIFDYLEREQLSDEQRQIALDLINSRYAFDGMLQRVKDDMNNRVVQSDAIIDARTNQSTGMVQPAKLNNDKQVHIVSGSVSQFPDGMGVDIAKSDQSVIVRDIKSGKLEQIAPSTILSLDQPQDPTEQKMVATEAIREQHAQAAADNIEGVAKFDAGLTYSIPGAEGKPTSVQIAPNEQGVIDNGDDTVNVSDGQQIFAVAKEVIQHSVDEVNIARVTEFEASRNPQKQISQLGVPYESGDELVINVNGTPIKAEISSALNGDGLIQIDTEIPINGHMVSQFTPEDLDSMLVEYGGQAIARPTEQYIEQQSTREVVPKQQLTALERVPKSENGEPLYEQVDSDTAWDAIVEQTDGDEQMAQSVIDATIADKESELKKIEKAKPKGAASITEKIAAEKERKAIIDNAQQQINQWKKIASTSSRRQQEAESIRRQQAEDIAAAQKIEEEKLREEREEAERIEREALNGVPDMLNDTPLDARARSYRRVNGHKVDRQLPIQSLQGNEVAVKFSDEAIPTGSVAIIDAAQLQPSHIQGVRNPLHFIDEAQPKERNDEASILSAQKIASNIRPEEITSSVTAYTGAPTVNSRGEVIQGNNRSDALRLMWQGRGEQAQLYKQYLVDHAEEFGLKPDEIGAVEQPVLVNMLNVEDSNAIKLGQYVAQDTESGGVERIKPKNTLQRMGNDMQSFSSILLSSPSEEASFLSLIDSNGAKVISWMGQKGYISPTQYRSAFDSRGNLTAEVKNDIKGIMYQNIFQGNSTRLEDMFNILPAKAQKAILATAFRDYDSPSSERMIEEIQNSIKAYYTLSQSAEFNDAKNYKDTRIAVESWKIQYQIDDATGESYLPAENFSNFLL